MPAQANLMIQREMDITIKDLQPPDTPIGQNREPDYVVAAHQTHVCERIGRKEMTLYGSFHRQHVRREIPVIGVETEPTLSARFGKKIPEAYRPSRASGPVAVGFIDCVLADLLGRHLPSKIPVLQRLKRFPAIGVIGARLGAVQGEIQPGLF